MQKRTLGTGPTTTVIQGDFNVSTIVFEKQTKQKSEITNILKDEKHDTSLLSNIFFLHNLPFLSTKKGLTAQHKLLPVNCL